MTGYRDAMLDSRINPGKLLQFQTTFSSDQIKSKGAFLNGEREGEFIWYFDTGEIECQCFFKKGESYGEHIYYDIYNCVDHHSFRSTDGMPIEELDYLLNEPRDDAFYVTLALYGIDKEYTIGVK